MLLDADAICHETLRRRCICIVEHGCVETHAEFIAQRLRALLGLLHEVLVVKRDGIVAE